MTAAAYVLALVVTAGNAVAQPPEPPPAEEHVVRAGETLAEIAAMTLGDARQWPRLYRANRDQIRDPAVLYPGQRLTIPRAETAADAPRTATPAAPADARRP